MPQRRVLRNLHEGALARTWHTMEPQERRNTVTSPLLIKRILQQPLARTLNGLLFDLLVMIEIRLGRQPT